MPSASKCGLTQNKINSLSRQGSLALFCQLVIGPRQAHLSCVLAALLGFYARPHWGYFHTATSYVILSGLAFLCRLQSHIYNLYSCATYLKLRTNECSWIFSRASVSLHHHPAMLKGKKERIVASHNCHRLNESVHQLYQDSWEHE